MSPGNAAISANGETGAGVAGVTLTAAALTTGELTTGVLIAGLTAAVNTGATETTAAVGAAFPGRLGAASDSVSACAGGRLRVTGATGAAVDVFDADEPAGAAAEPPSPEPVLANASAAELGSDDVTGAAAEIPCEAAEPDFAEVPGVGSETSPARLPDFPVEVAPVVPGLLVDAAPPSPAELALVAPDAALLDAELPGRPGRPAPADGPEWLPESPGDVPPAGSAHATP